MAVTASGLAATDTTTRVDRTAQHKAARQVYRESVAAGRPLSGRELAARFGYSRSWGRDRIREVRADTAPQAPDASVVVSESPENVCVVDDRPLTEPDATDTRRSDAPAARRVAWLAFIVGIAASVAANVMHAQIVSTNRAAWIGAAFWPVALLLAIEVLARVTWPRGSMWHRLARYAGTGMVAAVAAILSYRHMAGLLATWGEDTLSAYLGPLAVDGLMILAAAALLTTNTADSRPRDRTGH